MALYYAEQGDEDRLSDELCSMFDIFVFHLPLVRGLCERRAQALLEKK